MYKKTKVVITQLGSPASLKIKDVRAFLREFLSDERVIDINPLIWRPILYLFVLTLRPKKSAKAYARIWSKDGFPLIENTKNFVNEVKKNLAPSIEANESFVLSSPRIEDVFKAWEQEDFDSRADHMLFLPQFPQYSESTVASVSDMLSKALRKRVNIPHFSFVANYHRLKAFIDHSAKKIHATLDQNQVDDLVISFHGIPLRRVTEKKDEYYLHCFETFYLLCQKLKNIDQKKIHMTFQSRFGREVWLGPSTDEFCSSLVKEGSKSIAVYCPSFVVDCLETTDEIGFELGEEVAELGGKLHFVECLNDDPDWSKDYAHFINTLVLADKEKLEELFYQTDKEQMRALMPKQNQVQQQEKQDDSKLTPVAKSTLKIMFLTLFLDLIGFSIIFPMFPALAKHYMEVDGDNFFLKIIMNTISGFTETGGGINMNSIVLFGGFLGALYSLLQFFAAPLWGGISDKIGRKPVLLISTFGLFISYVIWIFSGSFTLLILARFIGGIMSGNMSVASAAVADITNEKTRSKGMAIIGISFGLGFVVGPAVGGILSLYDLTLTNPEWIQYGINPFSVAAIGAAILSFLNFIWVAVKFKETLVVKKKEASTTRTANIFNLFRPLKNINVNFTNYTYFFFISAFSGMEFTLTFLAVERLANTSMQNAYMFIFIGVVLALIQGGYVRRRAHIIGEKKMAMHGLISIIPGLIAVAFAHNNFLLYLGLFFLAIGSAMVIPTLTSLVSLYSPKEEQGKSLGLFRSLGALGRVIGPIIASLLYWRLGSTLPYLIGAGLILIPMYFLTKVGKVKASL